jgi:hypothetical protein
VNHQRVEHGLVAEMAPHPARVNAWFAEALLELGGDFARLDATVAAWGADPHWRSKRLPLRALLKEWRKYVPRADVRRSG